MIKDILRSKWPRRAAKADPYKDVVVRPIEMILDDLAKLGDSDWEGYIFSREMLNDKISKAQRTELMEKAILCGEEAAARVTKEYGSGDPSVLAEKMDLKINRSGDQKSSEARVLFAEYQEPDSITIYMENISKAVSLLEGSKNPAFNENLDVFSVLLAHELYHVLEYRHSGELWSSNFQIQLWKLGPIRFHSRVRMLGEISAMAFARKLTSLPFSPHVFDVVMLYAYSQPAGSKLYEEVMNKAGRDKISEGA